MMEPGDKCNGFVVSQAFATFEWNLPQARQLRLLSVTLCAMPVEPSGRTPDAISKAATFWRRLGSSVLLWAIVLAGLFSGNRLVSDYVVVVILTLLGTVGLMEFYDLVEKRQLVCFKASGVAAGLLLMIGTFLFLSGRIPSTNPVTASQGFETATLILFVLGLCVRQFISRSNTAGILAISTTLFGLMYVPWLLSFIQKINFFPFPDGSSPTAGTFYVLYFVVITKFSDTGAYAIGSLLGRHKMIPRISPSKTWEGFAGALAVSTGASVAFAVLANHHLVGMTIPHAIALGVLLSVSAVIGDLIESIFKREAGVKDSGRLFPGIGGILDLLDSLLFNAPLMYLYLRHVLAQP
jgi:phosphatidate cytidylyltransferase